jgi:NAD+ diphosphatase
MIGFEADYASGDAHADEDELEDVRWFTREEVEQAVRGQGEMKLPPPVAIARRLIDEWLED